MDQRSISLVRHHAAMKSSAKCIAFQHGFPVHPPKFLEYSRYDNYTSYITAYDHINS